jgi:transaldolase
MTQTANPLQKLAALGQSVWLDDIHRGLLDSGEFQTFIDQYAVTGVTSNPAILKKAILDHSDYDEAIARLARTGCEAREAYESLVIEDLRRAADALRPTYDGTDGLDGYVSLEVSPHHARDLERTLEAARYLWAALDRPNGMIKVPATTEGIAAVRTLIAEGINVNATLLFSLSRYRDVANAYTEGLHERLRAGRDVHGVASVASFFMSRIDSLIDARLDALAGADAEKRERIEKLRGELATASGKLAYQHFKRVFSSNGWKPLLAAGARPQRLLWASTSTKDPAYSDVKYVEALIGPQTVNTLPLKTLEAYRDHGEPEARVEIDADQAILALTRLAELGIDLGDCTRRLEEEGIRKFVEPYDLLLKTLGERLAAAR